MLGRDAMIGRTRKHPDPLCDDHVKSTIVSDTDVTKLVYGCSKRLRYNVNRTRQPRHFHFHR